MPKDLQLVGFRIGNETFAVDIAVVREIVRVPEITALPDAPGYVEGVMNLRGEIVTVIDLRKRFGQTEIQPSKKNRVLVAELEDKVVGLIVNSASEVLKIPPSQIEPPAAVFQEGQLNYVTGVGNCNGRLIILLDLAKLLKKNELQAMDPVSAAQLLTA